MDAISMLHPEKRCVRSKMALFLRLWMVRHRYEQLRPFGNGPEECLEFHLEQLRESWTRVMSCHRALGLDVRPFTPEEHFEAIYVVSGFVERAVAEARTERPELGPGWREYVEKLNSLSHEDNPFEFSDRCHECFRRVCLMLDSVKTGFLAAEFVPEVVPFEPNASAAASR